MPKGEVVVRRAELGVWVSRYKLLDTKYINNKVLLYSPGNYIQYPVINNNGKVYIYMYN